MAIERLEQLLSAEQDGVLAELKGDPGKPGLNTILEEVDKLERVRGLGLPVDLFADCSEKLIAAWRARAAAAYPSDLRAIDQPPLVDRHDPVDHVLKHRAGAHLAVAQRGVEDLQLLGLHEQIDIGRDLDPQHIRVHRREDEVHRAAGISGLRRPWMLLDRARDENDRRQSRLAALPDQPRRLIPIQGRHPDIHQDQGKPPAQDRAQRGASGVGLDDHMAQRREDRPNRQALALVVIDDQDRGRRGRAQSSDCRLACHQPSAAGDRPTGRLTSDRSRVRLAAAGLPSARFLKPETTRVIKLNHTGPHCLRRRNRKTRTRPLPTYFDRSSDSSKAGRQFARLTTARTQGLPPSQHAAPKLR